jgi:hypothetical protein
VNDPKPKVPPVPGDLADALLVHAAEIERLRGVIKAVVFSEAMEHCPVCTRAKDNHRSGCPWPALVAEAEKP